MAAKIKAELPCPVAVTEMFAKDLDCPVFLSPTPLHQPMDTYLTPWKDREIWLEAALCQEEITVTEKGLKKHTIFPTEQLSGGFYDEELRCCYHTEVSDDAIRFTLFDTPESLTRKLELAHALGVRRAVGLYQELGTVL